MNDINNFGITDLSFNNLYGFKNIWGILIKRELNSIYVITLSILIALFLSACGDKGGGSRIIGAPGGGTPGGGFPGGETSQQWTFTAAGPINSSPAIGNDGTIYVGSEDSNLYAMNPDGTL